MYIIFGSLDFLSKIRFRCISKYMNSLEIYDFKNIDKKYLLLLTDKILFNYHFVKYLNANNNKKITNVNHMEKLIELDASGKYSGINDNGIKNITSLIKLNVKNNKKI
jgi:hypothetical protein